MGSPPRQARVSCRIHNPNCSRCRDRPLTEHRKVEGKLSKNASCLVPCRCGFRACQGAEAANQGRGNGGNTEASHDRHHL